MWRSSEQDPLCPPPIEESGPLANNAPPTGYESNFFDDFHYSETTEIFLQESSSDTMPLYLHDAEPSDETIGRALCSPLFIQEREEPAGGRQAYHSFEESLLPSQSLSVCPPRLAWYRQKKWKNHQNTVYWVDIKLGKRKDLSSIKHDRTQSSFTTHSLYPEGYHDGNWRNH